ncbi:MAG: EscN/YscN/HrcN family type III secretion system ATPase [Vulcanimicrobiaceae bacterium]
MIGQCVGSVVRTQGELVVAALPLAGIGDGVWLTARSGERIRGRVLAVNERRATISPLGSIDGLASGDRAELDATALAAVVGFGALGRAYDAHQIALDGAGALAGRYAYPARHAPTPATRRPVDSPLWTGIRAIDGLLTIGRGARIGIFGAPGGGKSRLLEMIAAGVSADAVVIGLVGERGREGERWIDRLADRCTIVCATGDRSAGERVRAAELAMLQAEALRSAGGDAVLILDSLARYVAALREQRVALGEPVGRGGYPPAVFAELARYLERGGPTRDGSITIVATVLADGGDEREPLSDAARSLLDGHVALSPELARAGRFPAIDVLASASRTMPHIVGGEHRTAAAVVRAALAVLDETREARRLGIGERDDPPLARAIACEPQLEAFLRQADVDRSYLMPSRLAGLAAMLGEPEVAPR